MPCTDLCHYLYFNIYHDLDRDPINRIKSLYWYEHVLWFHRFANKPGNTRNYHDWVYAWLDGSDWKYNFTAANPGNNYMEIENYYVKALIGWNKESLLGLRIGEEELERAKGVLESFDIVITHKHKRITKLYYIHTHILACVLDVIRF